MNKKILLYFSCFLFLYSCQTVKDGLTGKKQENSDEFLVIKKNPLEIPPNFDELPVPQTEKINDQSELVDEEIKDLLNQARESVSEEDEDFDYDEEDEDIDEEEEN